MESLTKEQNGFTLLEILIVLSVLTIILSISFFSLKSFWATMQKNMFLNQVQSDIYFAHSYAINREDTILFRFSRISHQYEAVSRDTNKVLINKKLPAAIRIEETNLPSFYITPDGNVSNFGTMMLNVNGKTVKITFYIGRGRFLVEEQ
ncbi:prepilin-type N-terminal cleavage/methylation domain-containing protein [Bacillus sp. FJAT-49732]|uniref:Prepilin-type N-terminal cleavage/methylation domain-containing protein n=1 Tax=Lederbergia citrisecunda TaxID=2833583 RepID=A0A942TPE0_9BACI|nr:competence type IV pilus minor pilin ComGD [Lederbergia citrisecunda]MBS4199657.1 prepilin-type N-terminal cleavage/methylation domain-containing protein [Lederbergia citrisecunda]